MPYKSVDHIALLSCCEAFSPGSNLLKAGNKIVLYLDSMPVSARAFDQQDLRQLSQKVEEKKKRQMPSNYVGISTPTHRPVQADRPNW